MKKKFNKRRKKIKNILKGKKIKWKKLVAGVLDASLLCVIHGATIKNILFEYGDDTNTFHAFNPTQAFLHFKKILLLTRCGVRDNMLPIILLHNGYLKKYIEIIFFYFLKLIFYIITSKKYKTSKNINLNYRKKI